MLSVLTRDSNHSSDNSNKMKFEKKYYLQLLSARSSLEKTLRVNQIAIEKLEVILVYQVACRPIRRGSTVQNLGQISLTKQNINKYFSGDLISVNFLQKHTYIRNWSLVTPLMLCVLVLYILSGGTHSLKSAPNDRFFLRNFSWQFYLLLKVFGRNLLRENRRRNTFCILF